MVSKGYSLIVFITADGFQPIQLGLGFSLLGIGGMVAVNRTFDEAVLREGLKSDTLASLLFPRNPVANAPAIIRSLSAAFPARSGSYMVGLLVRIGWFTPPLVIADLALIVEFGARKRLLVLGRVHVALPSPDQPLLRITLDSIGVFDFDAGTTAIDAVLVDSRLLERFVISGAAALRARWTSPRSFALAVGGMNKGFPVPADFPLLERVTLSLTTGDNPRLTCESYFALTSNTVQFGAAAHLYAAAYGFAVVGDAGYDVLIQLDPFHFLADFFASMQLMRGSRQSVQGQGRRHARRPGAAHRARQVQLRDPVVGRVDPGQRHARRGHRAAAAGGGECARPAQGRPGRCAQLARRAARAADPRGDAARRIRHHDLAGASARHAERAPGRGAAQSGPRHRPLRRGAGGGQQALHGRRADIGCRNHGFRPGA